MINSNIKKFKNGNITLFYNKIDSENIDGFYELMTMKDLYIQTIDGFLYVVDYNTQKVYDVFSSYLCSNVLLDLERQLIENNGTLKIVSMSKKDCKELLEILNKEDSDNDND